MTHASGFVPVKSSNIEAVGYRDGAMHVRFKGGGTYAYRGVPHGLFQEMLASDSVGKFLHSKIKGVYEHAKV